MPTYVTAYDHPDVRRSLPRQIDAAVDIFKTLPTMGREILVKPEAKDEHYVSVPSMKFNVKRFAEFDIIGITEAELGESIIERMANIARLRIEMDATGLIKPLHIFGSLDPICTPLYFLAGADIFDGLSWIRLAYWRDMAVYHKNRAPVEFGPSEKEVRGLMRSRAANLHYLSALKGRFDRYLLDKDVTKLGTHSDLFDRALDDLRVRVGEVV